MSDFYINQLLNDSNYLILENGLILSNNKGNNRPNFDYSWWIVPTNETFQGYQRITYKGNTLQIHRIIYWAFNGPIKKGNVINHRDGNPKNNSIDNLEQLSHRKNILKSKNPETPKKRLEHNIIRQIQLDHKNGLSYRQLVEKYSLAKGTIYGALKSKRT